MGSKIVYSAVIIGLLGVFLWTTLPTLPDAVELKGLRSTIDIMVRAFSKTGILYKRHKIDLLLAPILNLFASDPATAPKNERMTDLGGVPVLVLKPKNYNSALKYPAVVFYHGGGFALGDVWLYEHLTQKIANDANVVVFSVEYRLAPAHPFPIGIQDAVAVAKTVFKQADELGVDKTKIILAGDSAGGNLVANVGLELAESHKIRAQVMISPWLQMANLSLPSIQLYKHYFALDLDWTLSLYAGVDRHLSAYAQAVAKSQHVSKENHAKFQSYFDINKLPADLQRADMKTVTVSESNEALSSDLVQDPNFKAVQALAINKKAWPLLRDDADLKKVVNIPTLIQAAEYDFLRDEELLYAARLRSLGAQKLTVQLVENGFHVEAVFPSYLKDMFTCKASEVAYDGVLKFIIANIQ